MINFSLLTPGPSVALACINGYLARVADSNDLAEKCRRFVALSNDEHARMGQASRRKAEREFDEQLVFDKYLDCLRPLRAAARAC